MSGARPCCENCVFYVRPEWLRSSNEVGACHRYPPVLLRTDRGLQSRFPLVSQDEFCGEHAVAEK